MLHLVPQKPTLTLHGSLLLDLRTILQFVLLRGTGTVDCLLDSLQEIHDFVVDEILVNLHLLLKIAHLALVYQLKNARARILDSLHVRLLQVEHLLPYLRFKLSVARIVDRLPLQVEQLRLLLDEFEVLEVSTEESGEVVELV